MPELDPDLLVPVDTDLEISFHELEVALERADRMSDHAGPVAPLVQLPAIFRRHG